LVSRKRSRRPGIIGASHSGGHRAAAGIHDGSLYRGEITTPLCICRYCGGKRRSSAQTETFPAEKPESLVAAIVKVRNVERTASVCSELVLREWRPFLSRFVQEVICVENFVAQVLIGCSMEAVGAGFRAQVDYASRSQP
jgi:hypothetical protein